MKISERRLSQRLISLFLPPRFIAGLFFLIPCAAHAISISGPVSASSVTVMGDVTVSSMTVSSLTVTNLLSVTGHTATPTGVVVHIASATTQQETSYSAISSFTAASNLSASIALLNQNDYLRISVSGSIEVRAAGAGTPAYISVFKDSVNLGDSSLGFAMIVRPNSYIGNASFTFIAFPGDTNPHTYQIYLKSNSNQVFYPNGMASLVLEEFSR